MLVLFEHAMINLIYFHVFRELLTPQQHYDWGLRALKTILKGCGSLLQNSKQTKKGSAYFNFHSLRKGNTLLTVVHKV